MVDTCPPRDRVGNPLIDLLATPKPEANGARPMALLSSHSLPLRTESVDTSSVWRYNYSQGTRPGASY